MDNLLNITIIFGLLECLIVIYKLLGRGILKFCYIERQYA
jgi:hypothetical protein